MLQQQLGELESLQDSDSSSELGGAPDNDTSIDGDEIDTEHLDPRVQGELEKLNEATDAINRLEKQLDEAKIAGRQAFHYMTQHLHEFSEKLGKCIPKARPYYESRVDLKKAQTELQQAALLYEKANAGLKASKEIVKLTEEGLGCQGGKLDETWQEMLNYATKKVAQCESDLRQRQRDHWHASKQYGECDGKVKALEKKFKSSINKSKQYYELRAQMNHFVEKEKFRVYQLEQSISQAKSSYSDTLANLEGISEQIHRQRRRLKDEMVQRDSGCGTISDNQSFTDSLDMVSLGDVPVDNFSDRSISSGGGNEATQKMFEALHDIICQSKSEEETRSDRECSQNSALAADSHSITTLRSPDFTSSVNHSLKNAQNFHLLEALKKEMSRLQTECNDKMESRLEKKKPLKTEVSVDSAMDSGSDCEIDALDDDLIDKLQLDVRV